jgi:hypothetical protein
LRRVTFAASVVAALVAVGCSGSDGGAGSELAKPEYLKRANAICAKANEEIAALPAPDLADPVAAPGAIRAVVSVQRDEVRRLRDLGAPHTDVPAIAAWLRMVDLTLDQADLAVRALEHDDIDSVNTANAKGRDSELQADALARQYGLIKCAAVATGPSSPT